VGERDLIPRAATEDLCGVLLTALPSPSEKHQKSGQSLVEQIIFEVTPVLHIFSGHGGDGFVVGLDDLRGLFQP